MLIDEGADQSVYCQTGTKTAEKSFNTLVQNLKTDESSQDRTEWTAGQVKTEDVVQSCPKSELFALL